MTSAYRRDHIESVTNDEFDHLTTAARNNLVALEAQLAVLYPLPAASNGEKRAFLRAGARYLIDSGKASTAGLLT